ncbi:MAG: tRNA lysidine(34) synthetase TilS [Candidatus Aminicenantes bacterium]|nr:tRNA lysidine(34) synthetase TilS [Candidatus Aminicenantes bacterium]
MILERVKKTIQDYKLLEKKDRILIAYSGGADSTGLLALLLELREEWSFELFLGHFNHKLRQSADEDEQFVRGVAKKYSLPLYVGNKDVRFYAQGKKLNLEEAGRELRYYFLKKTAHKIGGAKIATGHTLTDQAETFLMRLMRGSGLRGLGGIFPLVEGMIVRPLIQVERQDIEAYLKEKGIEFRTDESNLDRRFLRNRIRLDLIPYIKKNFEPEIVSSLGRIASIIREEDSLLEKIAEEKAKRAISRKNNRISLEVQPLSTLPRAMARRVVRDFISELKGNLRAISFEDVESVLRLREGKEFPLRKGHVLRREQDQIFLKGKIPPKIGYEYRWEGKEPLQIKELKLKFQGKKIKRRKSLPPDFDDQTKAFLDLGKLKFPLLVRNRRDGDRYQPTGAPGQKKLKEIMRAKGIPLSDRDRRPVFLSGGKIVWVLGLPVSDKFKVKEGATGIFAIKKLQ